MNTLLFIHVSMGLFSIAIGSMYILGRTTGSAFAYTALTTIVTGLLLFVQTGGPKIAQCTMFVLYLTAVMLVPRMRRFVKQRM